MSREHWADDAACTGADDADMYPEGHGTSINAAEKQALRLYCNTCPVVASCLRDALVEEATFYAGGVYGARGGMTSQARKLILAKRRELEATA